MSIGTDFIWTATETSRVASDNLGAILAPLYVPWMALHYGRRAAFLVTGVLAAIWIALWLTRYFSARFHLNLSHLGLPLVIVYTTSAIGSMVGGWLPAPLRRLGSRTAAPG